jgi:hypothetical protein
MILLIGGLWFLSIAMVVAMCTVAKRSDAWIDGIDERDRAAAAAPPENVEGGAAASTGRAVACG